MRQTLLSHFTSRLLLSSTFLISIALISTACVPPEKDDPEKIASSGDPAPKCDNLIEKIKSHRPVHDQPTDESAPTITEDNGVYTVVVDTGRAILTPQEKAARYFDFDTNKFLNISDKDAYTTNHDWDFGLRAFEWYGNSDAFTGDIEFARVPDKRGSFDTFSIDDIKDLTFVKDRPLDKECKPVTRGEFVKFLSSSITELNSKTDDPMGQYVWFTISPTSAPDLKDDLYVIKSKSKGWTIKLVFLDAKKDAKTKDLTYTFKYARM